MHDIIIVGGGPAGLTASIYALRAGKSVLLIEKNGFGGQIAFSPKVENIPGFICVSGTEFADQLTEQAMNLGADVELETVIGIEKKDGFFTVKTLEESEFEGRSVILALGVKHRMLGLEKEEELIGKGLSFCAVCDGAFYEGQDVAMIGGGNSAMQEALLLSDICKSVTIIQNLSDFTGEKKLADALFAKENVTVHFDSVVTEYKEKDGELCGLCFHNDKTGADASIDVAGAFLAVGLIPENDAFADFAQLNAYGYFESNEFCTTKTDGIFVAGDCRSKTIRQVVTAAADGAIAATAACRYLEQ